MKRKTSNSSKMDTGRWLTTYADLMNNLLVMFILLYMMSVIDMQKFQKVMNSFSETFTGEPTITESMDSGGYPYEPIHEISEPAEESKDNEKNILDDLDKFVQRITNLIKSKGYENQITVERVDDFVYFRFDEGVLFYPNRATLKPTSYDAISFIADVLKEAYTEIASIEIAGHTAWVPEDKIATNFASWELSSDRSMTVLRYLVTKCGFPKDKMTILGYSSTQPYLPGTTEENKAKNRRVEIRISRLIDEEPDNKKVK